jgi:hypothetical protein
MHELCLMVPCCSKTLFMGDRRDVNTVSGSSHSAFPQTFLFRVHTCVWSRWSTFIHWLLTVKNDLLHFQVTVQGVYSNHLPYPCSLIVHCSTCSSCYLRLVNPDLSGGNWPLASKSSLEQEDLWYNYTQGSLEYCEHTVCNSLANEELYIHFQCAKRYSKRMNPPQLIPHHASVRFTPTGLHAWYDMHLPFRLYMHVTFSASDWVAPFSRRLISSLLAWVGCSPPASNVLYEGCVSSVSCCLSPALGVNCTEKLPAAVR